MIVSNELKEETAIEKHFIGGFGSVIEFINQQGMANGLVLMMIY